MAASIGFSGGKAAWFVRRIGMPGAAAGLYGALRASRSLLAPSAAVRPATECCGACSSNRADDPVRGGVAGGRSSRASSVLRSRRDRPSPSGALLEPAPG
jgi:hypothetical protein